MIQESLRSVLRHHCLSEAWSPDDWSYKITDHFPIKVIIERWAEYEQKCYGTRMYWPEEIWKYREYGWTRETSRAGYAQIDGEQVYLPGPAKWDALVESLKRKGWEKQWPLHMFISREHRRAMVGEGNHRLAIAREAKILVPVDFTFYVGGLKFPARSETRKRREREDALAYRLELEKRDLKKSIPKTKSKPLTPKEQKQVDELMSLLFGKS